MDQYQQLYHGTRAHTSVAYNGYLYVIVGRSSETNYLNDVRVAPVNANGTVGTWTATTSLPAELGGHTSIASSGYMYVLGGMSSTAQNSVRYAPINADGTIGDGPPLQALLMSAMTHRVVDNGFLYVIAGRVNLNDVQFALINTRGAVGPWTATTSFTTVRWLSASVAYNGYLYVIGGTNGAGSYLNDVQYAPISADGTIGTW